MRLPLGHSVCVVALLTGALQAGMSPEPLRATGDRSGEARHAESVFPESPSRLTDHQLLIPTGSLAHVESTPVPVTRDQDVAVDELGRVPALPGSASLYLCAIGTFGLWHVSRSMRRVDLGSVPEWFHAGAPLRVGHAVSYDIHATDLPVCPTEQVVELGSPVLRLHPNWEPSWLLPEDRSLPVTAPRGPPTVS